MTDRVEEIRPPNPLKDKVGDGGIDKHIIQSAEDTMQHNGENFLPVIDRHMKKIVDITKNKKKSPQYIIKELSHSITQLKAQGSMFNYPLVTEVSGLILNFLPRVKTVDSDILEIVLAYQVTVRAIATKELRGSKTSEGKALVIALKSACDRYCKHRF